VQSDPAVGVNVAKTMTSAEPDSGVITRESRRDHLVGLLKRQETLLVIAFIALFTFFTFQNSVFISVGEIGNNLTEFVSLILLAVGETFVIATGGIDLSVGSTAELAGVVGAMAMVHMGGHNETFILLVGTLVCIGVGALVGLVNAVLVNFVQLVPFVATLVTLGAGAGLALLFTGGTPVDYDAKAILLTVAKVGPFSYPAIIIILITIIAGLYFHLARFGRYTLAIGSNDFAARAAGINVRRQKSFVYVLSGIFAGLTGMFIFMRLGSGSPTSADGTELTAIASVVIGGASLFGGSAKMIGTVFGALILTIVSSGLIIMNVSPNFNQVAIAICIALAASFEVLVKNARRKS
jgi:ribose transport system permease protein